MALKDFAVRVSLTITKPQLTAKDDKATVDAETANNAHGAGQYRKDLYPKHLIAPIGEVESSARAYITRSTLDGVLPAARFMDFAGQLSQYEVMFNQAVTVFLSNYVAVITAARQAQGGLFDPGLYPDLSTLRSRFTWRVRYDPIADTSQFAAILAPMEEAAKLHLANAITTQCEQQAEGLVGSAVARLQDVVAKFSEAMGRPKKQRIDKKTGGVMVSPPIIRAAVRDNIDDCVAMLTEYADALPAELGPLMEKAALLSDRTMEDLKDDAVREVAKVEATALLREINEVLGYPTDAPATAPAAPVPPSPMPEAPEIALEPPTPQGEAETIIAPPVVEMISPPPAPPSPNGDLFAAIDDLYEE